MDGEWIFRYRPRSECGGKTASPPAPPSTVRPARGATTRLPLLALFLVVLGARLWLVDRYGNPLPYWDQWDGEATQMLQPWLAGHLRPGDLAAAHAEHRVLLTRVLALILTAANGEWNARVEMVANAGLAAAVAAGLAWGLRRALFPRGQLLVPIGAAALFSLPYGWENTLGGFQSQFYFLLGNSLLALWGLGGRRAGSAGWWLGAAAALAACFSMGSGLLAAVAVAIWTGGRLVRARRRPEGGELATLAVCAAVLAVGRALQVPPVAGHAALRVTSTGDFLAALGRYLSWPRAETAGWEWTLTLVPLLWLAGRHVLRFSRPARVGAEDYLLLLATWVGLQVGAMAFVRGGVADMTPPSRYGDILGLGALLAALAVGELVAAARPPAGRSRRLAAAGAGLWAALLLVGLGDLTVDNFRRDLPERRARQAGGSGTVRRYLTGDADRRELLDAPRDDAHLPYPRPEHLLALLDDPGLRGLLPAGFRPGPPGPLTRAADALAHGGGALFTLGLGVAMTAAWTAGGSRSRRRRTVHGRETST